MSLEANYKVRIAGILSGMLISLLIVASVACSDAADKEDMKPVVVDALDALAEDLAWDRLADADAYAERLQVYLEAHPTFFGSAAALLDPSGEVIASPYVYRTADGYGVADLAAPSYSNRGKGLVRRSARGRRWCVDRTLLRRGRRRSLDDHPLRAAARRRGRLRCRHHRSGRRRPEPVNIDDHRTRTALW